MKPSKPSFNRKPARPGGRVSPEGTSRPAPATGKPNSAGKPVYKPAGKPAATAPVKSSGGGNPPAAPTTDWNQVADWYDTIVGDQGSEYHQHVVLPGLLRMLKPTPGMRILDIACGQGVLCRQLQEKGAIVTGLDAAPRLLEAARKRSHPDIRYVAGDARDLAATPGLEAASFDAATIVLAVQNISPLKGVFDSAAWALKPGGRLLLVMMHPAFRSPKATSWGWEGNQTQYRRVDRYLMPRKEPIVSHPGKKDGKYTWTFHWPLQSYVKSMAAAGFLIDGLEEWAGHKVSEPGPRAKAENNARAEIPLFMAIRAVKSSPAAVTGG